MEVDPVIFTENMRMRMTPSVDNRICDDDDNHLRELASSQQVVQVDPVIFFQTAKMAMLTTHSIYLL